MFIVCFIGKRNSGSIIPSNNPKKERIISLFVRVSYAENHNAFEKALDELKRSGREFGTNFLANLLKEHYANAYFDGIRLGETCSKVAECFSTWILEVHFLLISSFSIKFPTS